MAPHPKPWTQEDDDVLREAVLRGRPLWNICSQLHRTGPAVRSRIYVLGLSYRIIGPKTRRY
jgi:hypothetical protein